jgi:hypothetical protein
MSDAEEDGGRECPRFLALESPHVLAAWSFYTRGILPSGGGWEAQTEWWCQALELIAATIQEWRAQYREPADGAENRQ